MEDFENIKGNENPKIELKKMEHRMSLIRDGLESLSLSYTETQVQQLAQYLRLMAKWNKIHNLTRVPEENWVDRHIVDSLTMYPHVGEGRHIDVGSGAGLPGIPLAVMKPDTDWVLLDSIQKRIGFLQQVVIDLKLKNVTTVCARVENYKPEVKFNNVLTRAFASLADMIRSTEHLCAENGKFLAMKANLTEDELGKVTQPFKVESILTISRPNSLETRQLVTIIRMS